MEKESLYQSPEVTSVTDVTYGRFLEHFEDALTYAGVSA